MVLSWVHIAVLPPLVSDHLGESKCPASYFLLPVHGLIWLFLTLKTFEEASCLSLLAGVLYFGETDRHHTLLGQGDPHSHLDPNGSEVHLPTAFDPSPAPFHWGWHTRHVPRLFPRKYLKRLSPGQPCGSARIFLLPPPNVDNTKPSSDTCNSVRPGQPVRPLPGRSAWGNAQA